MLKRFFVSLVLAFGLAMAVSAQVPSVNSWKIDSINPVSFTSVDAVLTVNMTNPGRKVTMTEISGIIYNKQGEMFIIGTAADLVIPKGTSDVVIKGRGNLASYMAMLSLLRNFTINPADYTVDVKAMVKRGRYGKAHLVEKKGVPLSSLIGK